MDTAIASHSSTSHSSASPTATAAFPTVSRADLAATLGRADAPLILDVRREPKFLEGERIVCGAVYCTPEEVQSFARSQTPREVVAYCVFGHNVSEDAVTQLSAAGWRAHLLAGGIEGGKVGSDADADTPSNIAAWRAQSLPTIKKRPDWGVTGQAASRWITRARPKIDRIACPWLIQRFIDPRAQFFYAPTEQVFSEAQRLNAVPYDIPGAPVSHTGSQGELCSFDALLSGFDLHIDALDVLARIVRGADTDRLDLAPQSAGLLATSLGMSALHTDDHAMLAAMLPVYDALYAWCVQSVAGQAERHSWQPDTMKGKAV
jgi:rhodanese-related sulfurtransferase